MLDIAIAYGAAFFFLLHAYCRWRLFHSINAPSIRNLYSQPSGWERIMPHLPAKHVEASEHQPAMACDGWPRQFKRRGLIVVSVAAELADFGTMSLVRHLIL